MPSASAYSHQMPASAATFGDTARAFRVGRRRIGEAVGREVHSRQQHPPAAIARVAREVADEIVALDGGGARTIAFRTRRDRRAVDGGRIPEHRVDAEGERRQCDGEDDRHAAGRRRGCRIRRRRRHCRRAGVAPARRARARIARRSCAPRSARGRAGRARCDRSPHSARSGARARRTAPREQAGEDERQRDRAHRRGDEPEHQRVMGRQHDSGGVTRRFAHRITTASAG